MQSGAMQSGAMQSGAKEKPPDISVGRLWLNLNEGRELRGVVFGFEGLLGLRDDG